MMSYEKYREINEPCAKRARFHKDGKRKYAFFPCDECITLAVCKHKEDLICPILHDYIREGIYYHGIRCRKLRYRLKKISDCFGRVIQETSFENIHKLQPDLLVKFVTTI